MRFIGERGLNILATAFFFAVFFVSPAAPAQKDNRLKPKLERVFSRFLQRDLTIGNLRWVFFPVSMAATDIKLWEKPGLLMGEAPSASMRLSLKTLTSGRLRVHRMTFNDGHIYLRFTHDAKTNLAGMVVDLAKFARANYKPGQKQKVAYNLFKIKNARLHVIDAETGSCPLGAPLVLNGGGDVSGLGPQTKFPFHLTAVSTATANPINLDVRGTISNRPIVKITGRGLPVKMAVDFLPALKWFEGSLDATADFSKAAIYTFWRVTFEGDNIRARADLPFPKIKVDGKIHPYAPSTVNLTIQGEPTQFDAALRVKDLISKKVSLSIQSRDAEIAEIIDWCRSGYLMTTDELSAEEVKTELGKPLTWDVSGTAHVQADFSSVLGPKLLREVDGRLKLHITDGRLTEMPGFVKALALLNLASVMKERRAGERGLPFKTIYGVVDIKDGVATTRDLILLDSPVLDVAFGGHVNFPKNVINARVRLGKVWFVVKGPIDNPAVLLQK